MSLCVLDPLHPYNNCRFLILDTIPHWFPNPRQQKTFFFQKHLHKVIKILIGTGQAQPCVLVGSTLDFFYNKEVARENRFVTRTSSLNKDFGLKWNFIVVYTVNVFIGHKNFVASGRRLL